MPWCSASTLQKLDLKRQNAVGGQFQAPEAAPYLVVVLAGYSIFSHLIANLSVYSCTKFGAFNPRINEIRSDQI
jgi:hypothetical protein